jgi:hypothetical protein
VPVVVRRVTDQDAAFLRFLDANQLKPGEEIHVDARDESADSVSVRGRNTGSLTIGARAASKLLVEAVAILAMVLGLAGRTDAQTPAAQVPAPSDSSRPWEIEDNSFLVEEAFNQEAGVVQTIFGGLLFQQSGWALTSRRSGRPVDPAPAFSLDPGERADTGRRRARPRRPRRHRAELPLSVDGGRTGKARHRAAAHGAHPTGNQGRGLGVGAWGWQMNLPVSKQHRDFYFHGNVGMTWYPRVTTERRRWRFRRRT